MILRRKTKLKAGKPVEGGKPTKSKPGHSPVLCLYFLLSSGPLRLWKEQDWLMSQEGAQQEAEFMSLQLVALKDWSLGFLSMAGIELHRYLSVAGMELQGCSCLPAEKTAGHQGADGVI